MRTPASSRPAALAAAGLAVACLSLTLSAAPHTAPPATGAAPATGAPQAGGVTADRIATLAEIASRLRVEESTSQGAWKKLAWLADRIGARLSGSPQAEQAVAWAVEEFKRDGFAGARTEKVMVPRWERGEASAAIVAPIARSLSLLALGMSDGTPPGGIAAEVVEADSLEAMRALGDRVRGRIVLLNKPVRRDPEGAGYAEASPLRHLGASESARLGAVAMLIRSLGSLPARLPHTGSLRYLEDAPRIPAAALAEEDADLLHRLLATGETVRVRLTLGCRTLPDVASANVVADWPGSERPEELVVLGAHLDSWDVGTGATDDGAGVVMVMETLRLLRRLDLKPRRTLRAVLYMNEENGVRGGRAYAETHAFEMSKHTAAIEADRGAGRALGFSVTAGAGGADTVRSLARALAVLGTQEIVEGGDGGVDVGVMRPAGVPLIGLRLDMTHYFDWHHTMADTLDKVDPAVLADDVVAMALMGYALADLDQPLPRVPPSPTASPGRP